MTGTYTLQGITCERGSCDHCGRELARLFRVQSPTGTQIIVGVSCAKKLTGYSWSVAQAERMQRMVEREARAEALYGDLYRSLKAQAHLEAERYGCGGAAGSGFIALRDDNAVEWATDMLAKSIAREGLATGCTCEVVA